MRQHLYTSMRSPRCLESELDQLLHQSRHNNALNAVTGLLWVDATMFVQVLEGSDEAIASLIERRWVDPRHPDIGVLLNLSIEKKDLGA